MTNYNNNTVVDTDICKSFAAFADLDNDCNTQESQELDNTTAFGEFAAEQMVFPAV